MFARLAPILFVLATATVPAFAVASSDWVCTGIAICHDAQGDRVRMTADDRATLRRHQALRALGCSQRSLTNEVLIEEINCFQRLFGLPVGPPNEQDLTLLRDAGISGVEKQVLSILSRRGLAPGGGDPQAKAEAAIDPAVIVAGHPDAASFIHPKTQETWRGAQISLPRWLSTRTGGGLAVNLRWPEPSAFAGREFSVLDRDEPAFLVSFGPDGGRVEGADGRVSEAAYVTRAGFTCIPIPAGFSDECLGLAIQKPGRADQPWQLRAALHTVDNSTGASRPLVFGSIEEGRAAFDRARAQQSAAAADTAARLAAGEMLETLPLHGIDVGLARHLSRVYERPMRPDAEFDTWARLPFLAYHLTYSRVCRDDFDGPAKVWRDVQRRLADSSDVPGNRYRIYENYVAKEAFVQEEYFPAFVVAVEVFRADLLGDAMRNRTGAFNLFVDFVEAVDRRMAEWTVVYRTLLPRVGCRGQTINRLESNLAQSHALIGK